MAQRPTFQAEYAEDGSLVLGLQGSLDHEHSGALWGDLLHYLQQEAPGRLICDLEGVTRINTAGVALLRSLEQRCHSLGVELTYSHLPGISKRFFRSRDGREERERQEPVSRGFIQSLGLWGEARLWTGYKLLRFLGDFSAAAARVARRPRRLRGGEFLQHLEEVGVNAVLLVCLLNALTGLIVVFQGISLARSFGSTIYVADMVVRSVAGQMAPVLTAIIIAGRSGAAFAAKIGTMKIRQEVDILSVLNFNITEFLVLPRVLAVAVATPFLIMLADAFGILGGMLTSKVVLDIPLQSYMAEVQNTLTATTIFSGLIRGAVFGAIIGLTGCFQGLQTENSADSVGVRSTSATVSSIILVILADTMFAVLFNALGW